MLCSVGPVGAEDARLTAPFAWTTGEPVVAAKDSGGNAWHALKDPTVVRWDGKWRVFCTVRGKPRSHAIVYLAFADWKDAAAAEQVLLPMHKGFFCAPQVFYFTPHEKWYLICQASDPSWNPEYQPAYATTGTLEDPGSWTPLTPMFGRKPEEPESWLDFWVICDESAAYLFFTSLDGRMWRCRTALEDFPRGWTDPALALEGDIFEASHTYRIKGQESWLTVVEAQGGDGWRYYKAYTADRLDGPWKPLAAERDSAFASMRTVTQRAGRWTDAISHGELLRTGHDEKLEIDPAGLRFLFQGVLDRDRADKAYGDIPWKLGLLEEAGTEAR